MSAHSPEPWSTEGEFVAVVNCMADPAAEIARLRACEAAGI